MHKLFVYELGSERDWGEGPTGGRPARTRESGLLRPGRGIPPGDRLVSAIVGTLWPSPIPIPGHAGALATRTAQRPPLGELLSLEPATLSPLLKRWRRSVTSPGSPSPGRTLAPDHPDAHRRRLREQAVSIPPTILEQLGMEEALAELRKAPRRPPGPGPPDGVCGPRNAMRPSARGDAIRGGAAVRHDGRMQHGLNASLQFGVTTADTATALGSGDVAALGTPRLIAWFEAATCAAVGQALDAGQTSVGARVDIEHRRRRPSAPRSGSPRRWSTSRAGR